MVEKNDPERIQNRSGSFFWVFCNRLTKYQIWSFFIASSTNFLPAVFSGSSLSVVPKAEVFLSPNFDWLWGP